MQAFVGAIFLRDPAARFTIPAYLVFRVPKLNKFAVNNLLFMEKRLVPTM